MTPQLNASTAANQPKSRKRGGQPGNINELSDLKAHQRSAKRHVALA